MSIFNLVINRRSFPAVCAILFLLFGGCGEKPDLRAKLEIVGPEKLVISCEGNSYSKPPFRFNLTPSTYLFKFVAPGFLDEWQVISLKPQESRRLQLAMTPVTASVLITTRPEGATLTVDGRVVGTTPIVLEAVGIGSYTGQLAMNGYSERAVNWTVGDGRPQKVLINLNANVGKMELESTPEKARVLIDGREVGVTPYSGEFKEGKYVVRLEREGCVPLEQTLALSRGEELKRKFKLTMRPGGIEIATDPAGAEIFVNNTKRGISPCTLSNLDPAVYEIRAEKAGFDSAVKTVEVISGSTDKISLGLQRSTGSLEFSVRPAGVRVLFDEKELGVVRAEKKDSAATVPFRLDALKPGTHSITVTHPRANPATKSYQVQVEKGQLTTLKPIDVWIANCEIRYRTGTVEHGAIYEQNDKEIFFGPEPGVKVAIDRALLDSIQILKIDKE